MKQYEIEVKPIYNQSTSEDIDIEKDDDVLIGQKIDVRLAEAKDLHDTICRESEENLLLFRGRIDEACKQDLAKYKSKTVLSRLFLTIRNLVGLATDNQIPVEVFPSKDNAKAIKKAQKVEANLSYGMLRTRFGTNILAKCLFDTWIKRDSYITWFWNYEKNDFDAEPASIEDISISPEAKNIQASEYTIYHPYRNRSWWRQNYPDHYEKIKFETYKVSKGKVDVGNDGNSRGSVSRFYAYWENDFMVMKAKGKDGEDIILEKKKNPYFEYRTPEEQFTDWAKETMPEVVQAAELGGIPIEEAVTQADPAVAQEFIPIVNYLPSARKPFIQISSIRLLNELYSENLVSHTKEVFISMNNKKRAFSDNLRGCNQKYVVAAESFTEEEARAINDEPNQVIRASFDQNAKPFYIEKGGEVPASFHEDIMHDEKYIDDVFGHHEISRGAGKADTLGQDQMNAESDRTPVRFQMREVESAVVELWEGWIQLMKMFYTEKHYAKKYGTQGAMEMVELMANDVEQGVEPHLRPGSLMPISKLARGQRAVTLFQAGALDPYTLFVELEMQAPDELSNRLINWLKFGMVSDQDPEELAADMQSQENSEGDMLDNPIERANQENESMQAGGEVPPTPPELVTPEHVKLHYAFYKDPNKKLDEETADMIYVHAETDKATLAKKMADGMAGNIRDEAEAKKSNNQPNNQQNVKK